MISRTYLTVFAAVLTSGLTGCYHPPPPTRADLDTKAECRQQVERQYNLQNRVDLTRRDERDYAFAATYNSGIPSRGLGAEYHREQMVTDCLRSAGDTNTGATPGVGPTFSPADRGAGTATLRP
ncbi:MAG: hypothetical protein RQ966_16675 [Acetobacteraceae bacterium]|nr:hypothetical protein [Acetobacteraceae bacterium]